MPVPEGLSFDHLDTLGTVAPYVYHLPFQDTLIPWSRRWLWGLRFPPSFDDHTELDEDCVLIRRAGLQGAPPTCSDSSPELIPAADGLCSAFCLDEAAEADVAASKELLPPHLKVSFCNRLSSTALVPQGPRPPRQQAGILLSFDVHTRSSYRRCRRGSGLPMHSTTHCAYLRFWRPCSALYNVYHTVLRPLRPGDVPAHSHRGGGASAFELLVIAIAAWQTLPGCDVHTGDACSPCSGGSDSSDRQCRSGSLWFSACPAQRQARLASALPPLYLRQTLRRRQFHRRPRSDDGSMPAFSSFYRRRSGAPRTHRTFWARPRLSWNLFLDLLSLNASGCCQKDVIFLDSCKHFGSGSASASVAVSSCCRHRQTLQQTLAVGLPRLPMSRVLDPKLQLPLMLEHVLLVLTGPEWRRGLAGWMRKVRTHRLGGGAPCFRCSFRLPPRGERLALAEASDSAISSLWRHKGTFSSLDRAAIFSSYMSRVVGPTNLLSVQSTAILFPGGKRRPSKDGAVPCIQDRASVQIRPFTLLCVGQRLPICLRSGHIAHSPWFRHFFYGRAGFRLMALPANGRTPANDALVGHAHCAICCHPPPGIGGPTTVGPHR